MQKIFFEILAEAVKKLILNILQNSQENNSAKVTFLIKLQHKGLKETQVQLFSCEFCKISKNTIFTEHL